MDERGEPARNRAIALDVRGLSVRYQVGDRLVRALDDVDVTVAAGQRLAVVGESGSGKSTLGLAVMGLLPGNARTSSTRLEVRESPVELQDRRTMRALRGRQVAMVFQDAKASLDPVRTVGSQIAEVLRVHRIVSRRAVDGEVVRLLRAVEISGAEQVARQFPHELSGGMRQRAMIAAALAGRPALLIADEPTSALDVTTQASVIDLLRRLGGDGAMATLLITHDLALVAGFAERVAVLYAGQLVELGTVDRTYATPAHPYTSALLRSIPSLFGDRARALTSIGGSLPDLTRPTTGCRFEPRCSVGHGRDVCRSTEPELVAVGDGTDARCHFPFEAARPEGSATPVELVRRARSAAPIAELRSIVKTFRRRSAMRGRRSSVRAVDGVDLTVSAGEAVGIVGESASGKTTLARIFVGLERADSGRTLVRSEAGVVGTDLPRDFVQFVFQDPGDSLDPLMTVGAIVVEPLVLRDGGRPSRHRQRAVELLADVGLGSELINRRPAELSGGQRQRVAIARALSVRPKVIIADEAVASLDMSARGQILNLFRRLQDEHGFAYVYISHDLSMVRHVCDRVVVMFRGRVVESATTDELFSEPRHPYTQALIAAVPVPDPVVERERAATAARRTLIAADATVGARHLDVTDGDGEGCAYRVRCPIAEQRCAQEKPLLDPEGSHGVACHFAAATTPAVDERQTVLSRD